MLTMKAIEAEGAAPPGSLEVVEREGTVSAVGKGFAVSFDRSTGLIVNGAIAGRRMILSGPYLHLSLTGGTASWAADSLIDLAAGGWVASSVAFEHREGELRARVSGHAGTLNVSWTITVDCRGEIRTVIESPPAPEAWREIGVAFLLSADLDSLSWQRESLWSTYPNDHIGRPSGTALKLTLAAQQEQYRVRPDHPWSSDGKDFFLFGWRTGLPEGGSPVPADFRATKERILRYALVDRLRGIGLEVVSDGAQAARAVAHADGTTTLLVLNAWNYRRLAWGNYEGATMPHGPDRAEYRIHLVTEQGTR
jgi:hypothetical protein